MSTSGLCMCVHKWRHTAREHYTHPANNFGIFIEKQSSIPVPVHFVDVVTFVSSCCIDHSMESDPVLKGTQTETLKV